MTAQAFVGGARVAFVPMRLVRASNNNLPALTSARGLGAGTAPDCDGDAVPAACVLSFHEADNG